MSDDENSGVIPVDERAGATLNTDDGCDWTEWLKWDMNSRRRISEKRFELPPTRPQIVPPSIKPKHKRRKKRRKAKEIIE